MLYGLELLGVFVFGLSGALAADQRNMDLFGFVVIALLTAVGGGTVRDIVLDVPVFWVAHPDYLWPILGAALITYFSARLIHRAQRLLIWADAVGLSIFSVTGTLKAYSVSGSVTVSIALGVVTGVLGGIVRDVVCNEIPLVLRQDIYATAAFAGALIFVALIGAGLPVPISGALATASCFVVRGSAIIWKWSLPTRAGGETGSNS